MPKIILCRGVQDSDKTIWAEQWVLEDPKHRVRFNNNDIRNMLGKYWLSDREVWVSTIKKQLITTFMKTGYDMIVDNMNLNPYEVAEFEGYIEAHNQVIEKLRVQNALDIQDDFKYKLEFKDFFTPLEVCIDRDSKRESPIGEEVIKKTYEKYKSINESV